MIPILYESNETVFTSNGLGRLHDCLRCEVTEERNGVYECEFDYPVTGFRYSDIQLGRIIGVEHDQNGDIQPFDIYACDRPINGVVTFHACHVSYRLNGIICLAPMGTNTLQNAFSEMEQAIGNAESGNFRYDTDFSKTEQRYMAVFDSVPRPAREILGGTEGSILDTFGGEYLFDKFLVNLKRKRGIDQDFTIRYGVNLTEYNEEIDFSEAYSWVWAYYKNGDEIAVSGYLDSGYTALGGRRVGAVLDVTDKFESTPTLAQLLSEARTFLSVNQPWLPRQTITVEFVEEGLNEFADLHKCNLCDTVRVIFPRYNMEGRFKIVKTVWDVLHERYIEMELGTLSTTLSQALGGSSGSMSGSSGSGSGVAVSVYSGAWSASSVNAMGGTLTDALNLPAGKYVITVLSPTSNVDSVVGISVNNAQINRWKQMSMYGDSFALILELSAASTVKAIAGQASAVSYSYLDRGEIKAIRFADDGTAPASLSISQDSVTGILSIS